MTQTFDLLAMKKLTDINGKRKQIRGKKFVFERVFDYVFKHNIRRM